MNKFIPVTLINSDKIIVINVDRISFYSERSDDTTRILYQETQEYVEYLVKEHIDIIHLMIIDTFIEVETYTGEILYLRKDAIDAIQDPGNGSSILIYIRGTDQEFVITPSSMKQIRKSLVIVEPVKKNKD